MGRSRLGYADYFSLPVKKFKPPRLRRPSCRKRAARGKRPWLRPRANPERTATQRKRRSARSARSARRERRRGVAAHRAQRGPKRPRRPFGGRSGPAAKNDDRPIGRYKRERRRGYGGLPYYSNAPATQLGRAVARLRHEAPGDTQFGRTIATRSITTQARLADVVPMLPNSGPSSLANT